MNEITLYKRVDTSNQIIEAQRQEIQRQKKLVFGLGKIIEKMMQDKEKIEKLEQQNQKYQSMYGEFEVPFLILRELFNSGQIKVGGIATPPTKFKHPAIEYKKANREKIIFWVTLFEQWGFIDNSSSRHYIIEMPFKQAKQILKNKLGEIDEK